MKTQNHVGLLAALLLSSAVPALADGVGPFANGVSSAQPAPAGTAEPNVSSADFTATAVVTGTDPLENPSGLITNYGFLSDGTLTHPDQNTYLDFPGVMKGPTARYNYGHHFLFQGHENAADLAYVTRVNLDVSDPAHRITLLTPVGLDGKTHLNAVDGSLYNPFTKTLLVTQEASPTQGGVVEITMGWPSVVTPLYGLMGRGGFEGIHTDNKGRVYLVEDSGGTSASVDPNDINGTKAARQPNSYIYRFVPYNKSHLSAGGKLQALQVSVGGAPLVFGGTSGAQVFADVWSTKQLDLHSGASFPTKWITIHDTAVNGTADFDANALARAAGATPFKRPENGVFQPNGLFRTFFFTTTGDTSSTSGSVPGLQQRGAYGGIFQLDMDARQETGKIHLFALGDTTHNSFDNITFGDSNTIVTGEDRGDTLHDQLNTLDSIWAYPLNKTAALRVLAQGRDASASAVGAEDNEPTGVNVSNGGSAIGTQNGRPQNIAAGARFFFTQQHGDDTTYEFTHN